MLPVLHGKRIHLVHYGYLYGREEVRMSAGTLPSNQIIMVGVDSLLFLDRHPQSKGACDNQVAPVEIGEQLYTLLRNLHTQAEAVVNVPLEHLHVVARVCPGLRIREFVNRSCGQTILSLEARVVLNLIVGGRSVYCKGGDPAKRKRAERKKDENGRTREALVLYVFWRRVARFDCVRDTLVVLQDAPALSTPKSVTRLGCARGCVLRDVI